MIRIIFLIHFLFTFQAFAINAKYSVSLKGVKSEDKVRIIEEFGSIKKNKFSLNAVDKVISSIYLTKHYSNVYAEKKSSKSIIITAEAIKRIQKINFKGNNYLSNSRVLAAAELETGEKFDKSKVTRAIKAMENLYMNSGYFNTSIDAQISTPENGKIIVSFFIEEGLPCLIKSIQINTKNPQLKTKLNKIVNTMIGLRLTKARQVDIQEEITNYLASNRYLNAKSSDLSIKFGGKKTLALLQIDVNNSFKYHIALSGNKQLSILELYRKINLKDYERGSSDPKIYIQEKIKDYYVSLGYSNVKIKVKDKVNQQKNTRWIIFDINEGHRIRFKKFEVSGRISKDPEYYENYIRENSTELIAQGYYNQKDLELGTLNLITHLQNLGFIKAKVASIREEMDKSKRYMNASIYIQEGPLTIINKINIMGNKSIKNEVVLEQLGLQKGSAMNSIKLKKGLDQVVEYFQNKGFLEMKLLENDSTIVSSNEKGTEAQLNLNIYEGPKVTIKDILIEGNSFTKDYVILLEIPVSKGDTLTPALLEDSTSRLNDLGIFNFVKVDTLEKNSNVAQRTLVITVLERDPGTFRLGLGITDEYKLTLRGFMGVSYNNLSGTARALSFRGDVNNHIQILDNPTYKLTIGYLEPFLFNTRTRGRVNVSHVQSLDIDAGGASAEMNSKSKISFSLDRKLSKNLSFTWTLLSIEGNETTLINKIGTESKFQVVTLGPTLTYDNRDSPFLPTEGWYARWNLDYSSPEIGSNDNFEFYKTIFNVSHYIKPRKKTKVIWANNVRGGYLENLSSLSTSGIPDTYAFFLGGRSTIRGFDASNPNERIIKETDSISAGVTSPSGVNQENYIREAQSFYLYKSEVRFPIYNDFGGVLFYDIGGVFAETIPQEMPVRQSAGFGLRYNTVFGPVSFEFGFKLNRQPGEDASKFHFSIGSF